MENMINVSHHTVPLQLDYETFTSRLETQVLKSLEPNWAETLKANPASFEQHINSLEGESGLMLFGIQAHGALLSVIGQTRKAKQYIIGNPMTATRMTRHNIRAALYAPLRILVYEENGKAFVEYDLPSTLFGQFCDKQITAVGEELDKKLLKAIHLADGLQELGNQ